VEVEMIETGCYTNQRDPFASIVRAIYLLLTQGRIHFPKNHLGEIVDEGEEFEIFRQMTLDPGIRSTGKAGRYLQSPFPVCQYVAGNEYQGRL
jgi:hypothetical protein